MSGLGALLFADLAQLPRNPPLNIFHVSQKAIIMSGTGDFALDTASSMAHAEACHYLSRLIGKNLRIHVSDGRVFGGQMKCTDKDRNIILALAYEYREPPREVIEKAIEESGNPSVPVNWSSRYVGLVVVPGGHVRKIELEETRGW